MNDQELARRLGHFDITVTHGKDGRYYVSCACRWKSRSHSEVLAYDLAVDHIGMRAERFRAEARRAGLTVDVALARWNGRWRNYANGIVGSPPPPPS